MNQSVAAETSADKTVWNISALNVCIMLWIVAISAVVLRFLPADVPFIATSKVVLSTFVMGILPGSIVVLRCWPASELTAFEFLGVSIICSLAFTQILTLAAIILHISASAILLSYLSLIVAALLSTVWRSRTRATCVIQVNREQLFIGFLLILFSIALFIKGSPFLSDEEQIHIGIIRRLATIPNPGFDTIYTVPGIVYTNPLPGTHYFMALISHLGAIDVLFVYHKLRFFWGPAAIILLYLIALKVFGTHTLASVVCVTALLFVLNGNFADVPGLYWAQLAPYSHPSDIPVSILMPAILYLSLLFFEAQGKRANFFYFGVSLLAALTLICSHFREILQVLVYLGSFIIALLLLRRDSRRLKKLLPLVASIIVMVIVYVLFHQAVAGHVEAYDASIKADMVKQVRSFSLADFFQTPFIPLDTLVYGWVPIILAISPLIVLAFGMRNTVWLVGMSIFVFLLVIRFPIFSIPYIYLSYYEVLSTPSRNITLFIYLETGIFLYLIAINVARFHNKAVSGFLAILISFGLVFVWRYRSGFEKFGYAPIFAPALLLFVGIFGLYLSQNEKLIGRFSDLLVPKKVNPRWRVLFVVLVVPIVIGTTIPLNSLLYPGKPANELALPNLTQVFTTPQDMLDKLGCLKTGPWALDRFNVDLSSYHFVTPEILACPLDPGLIEWAHSELPLSAVLITNSLNLYSLNLFIAQQIAAAPMVLSSHLLYVKPLFPAYYKQFDRTNTLYKAQPFFNASESLAERVQFLTALHVTHVFIDPMYYRDIKPILARWPDIFQAAYDDGEWAVFEVHGPTDSILAF